MVRIIPVRFHILYLPGGGQLERRNRLPCVFTDASSAILLYRSGLFPRAALAFSLILAGEVFREVSLDHYPGAVLFRRMAETGQIRIEETKSSLPDCSALAGFAAMDRGEQDTLSCYLAFKGKEKAFVLMDDGKGARFCDRHGIPFINALLVPKIFWYSGLMDENEAQHQMKVLLRIGRYSPRIMERANLLSAEDLAFFTVGEGRHA